MITDASGHQRLLSVSEKERLHLLKRNHTLPGLKSGEAKSHPGLEYAERSSMIGDAFHNGVVAWLFGHLFAKLQYLTRAPSMEEILQRRVWPLHAVRGSDVVHLPPLKCNMDLA